MSMQTPWQAATRETPAEFELDYVTIKVQAITKPGADQPELQVRLSTEFNTDWMENEFDRWSSEWENTMDEKLKDAYPRLKRLRAQLDANDRSLVDDIVNELEQCNPGLIRG